MIIKPLNYNIRSGTLPYTPGPGAVTANAMLYQAAYPLEFKLIDAATALIPAGDYIEFLGRNHLAVQVINTDGTFDASILIEATLDIEGDHWVALDTITTESIKQYSGIYAAIRASVSVYTSGTIDVRAIIQRV